jgi:hypothetical protein
VVTEIGPVVAEFGTMAAIECALKTSYSASVPLNETAVAPSRFVPTTRILLPGEPLAGEKLVTAGVGAGRPRPTL